VFGGVTLHQVQGAFVPDGGSGFLFLWGMNPPVGKGRPLLLHPNWLPRLLPGLFSAAPLTLSVLLPGPRSWKPTKVTGYRLPVPDGVRFLLGLAERFADSGLAPAPSLLALRDLAVLLVDGLAAGQAVPLLRAEAGVWSARWTPVLTGHELQIEALTAALPEIVRAVVPPGRTPRTFRPLAASALVQRFLSAGTEALARSFLAEAERPARGVARNANQAWVEALAGAPDLPPGLSDVAVLAGAVTDWAAPLQPVRGPEALRTGLRLSPPVGAEGDDEEAEAPPWRLSLTVHTGGEEPIVLFADEVWCHLGEEIPLGTSRYVGAEERLLADLPDLARHFPPLNALREEQRPAGIALTAEQVIEFLQHGAPALRSAGYLVQIDKGLLRTEKPSVSMHLRPKGQERMGLHQLIDVDWEIALGGLKVSLAELEALAEAQGALVQLHDRWVQIDKKAVAKVLKRIKPFKNKIALGDAVRLVDQVESATAEGWVKEMLDRLKEPAKIEPLPAPAGLQGTLRTYQQRGFEWLAFLRRYGLGACLADDMGLGKTIQLIALMLWERQVLGVTAPNLLVCPVSLVGNWQRELARFAPSLKVLLHHGERRLAGEAFAAAALAHDVVITTYSLVARDEADLAAVEWNGVVADEAQALKNPGTQHAGALARINSGYRIALTGTPLENQVFDVWALFQFLNPGLLGTKSEFRELWKKDEEALNKMRRRIRPFILRRVKSDPSVAGELPPKVENRVTTTLTLEQAALYDSTARLLLENVHYVQDDFARSRLVLSGLTRLKLICNHPAALLNDGGPLEGRSGKLDRLTEMLEEVLAEGDRALIFTQFPGFGRRLVAYWTERLGQPVLFLDGSTPRAERERLIAQFQGGEAPLFLLSLKAAGVGLNLTAANHVFHFDRWWNPAVEEQATDRAYRIGQTRQVMVHKLVTAGTMEERIDQILSEKRSLAQEVVATGDSWVSRLSTRELRTLINLEGE
jgi:superfamily II DNA or RNA helicase